MVVRLASKNVSYTAGATVVNHVFLCIVRHFSSIAFLCDTISIEEQFLYSPRLLTVQLESLQILQCAIRVPVPCGILSALVIVDLTTPFPPPKKRLPNRLLPESKRKAKKRNALFCKQYNPRPAIEFVTPCSAFDDRTTAKGSWPFPSKRKLQSNIAHSRFSRSNVRRYGGCLPLCRSKVTRSAKLGSQAS